MNQLTASLVLCAMIALTQAFTLPPGFHGGGETYDGLETYPYPETTTPGYYVPQCPEGWITYGIRCLLYVPETRTWSDAESHCYDGLVAALKDQFAEDIDDIMKKIGPEIPRVFVGGCNTDSSSWDWSMFNWWGGGKPSFIERTPEGSWECIEADTHEEKLPSICSITLM